MSVRLVEDPVVNNLLSRLRRNIVSSDDVLSGLKDGGEDDHSSGSGGEPLTEATDNAFYQGGFDYDYLDFLLSGEVDHDNVEKEDFDKPKIEFRDFPVEQGYVRIPVQYPGLTLTKIQAPNPKLWTAEESFITQVMTIVLTNSDVM